MLQRSDQKAEEIAEHQAKPESQVSNTQRPVFMVAARGFAQFFLMALVLFAGYWGMNRLIAQKEDPPSRPPFKNEYAIETVTAINGTYQPDLLIYGEIQAAQNVELRALVAGKIESVNTGLQVGSTLSQDAELLRIDPFQYESAVASARADLAETRARITENEARIRIEESRISALREQLEFAKNDLARMEQLLKSGSGTQKQQEDRALIVSQRRQSLEQAELNLVAERSRLNQLEAILQRQDNAVRVAERDLEDTVLRAPFTGTISQKNAAVGRLVSANDLIVTMYEAGKLEARFTLTDQRFGRIQSDGKGVVGRPVEVVWTVGNQSFRYQGEIERLSAQITSNRGGVEVIASIETGTGNAPLRPGAFVEVIVPDKAFAGSFRLPDTAIYDTDKVYVVREGKLEPRQVSIQAYEGKNVIVTGALQDGDQIMTTRIAEISGGLNVVIRNGDDTENNQGSPIALKAKGSE